MIRVRLTKRLIRKKDVDGLHTSWENVNYVNPPYSKMKCWIRKAYKEYKQHKTCICLVKLSTLTTKYFQECPGCEIILFDNRVKFPGFEYMPRFGSCLLVYRAGKTSSITNFLPASPSGTAEFLLLS